MHFKVLFSFAICLFLLITSCKNSSTKKTELSPENTVLVHDKYGEIRVPKNPKRVVVYTYQALDIMKDLGVSNHVIGFSKSNTPDYLKEFKADPSLLDFGGTKEPNFEKINEANPDLIIIEHRVEKDRDELLKIAPTLYIDVDYNDYIGSIRKNTETLAKVFGVEEKGAEVIREMDRVIEDNKAHTDDQQKALIVMYNNGNFSAFGDHSRYGFIHDDFNVQPVSKSIESSLHGYNISSEYIQEHNPDILFVEDKNAAHHKGDINQTEIENELVKQTKAYQQGKIIYLTPDLWYYGGGGTIGMKLMAQEIGAAFKE